MKSKKEAFFVLVLIWNNAESALFFLQEIELSHL